LRPLLAAAAGDRQPAIAATTLLLLLWLRTQRLIKAGWHVAVGAAATPMRECSDEDGDRGREQ